MTELTDISIEASRFTGPIEEALEEYMEGRAELYTTKKKGSFPHGHGYTSRKRITPCWWFNKS